MRRELEECRDTVDGMSRTDAIAAGVAAELNRRDTRRYSWLELSFGGLVAVGAVGGLALSTLHAFGVA